MECSYVSLLDAEQSLANLEYLSTAPRSLRVKESLTHLTSCSSHLPGISTLFATYSLHNSNHRYGRHTSPHFLANQPQYCIKPRWRNPKHSSQRLCLITTSRTSDTCGCFCDNNSPPFDEKHICKTRRSCWPNPNSHCHIYSLNLILTHTHATTTTIKPLRRTSSSPTRRSPVTLPILTTQQTLHPTSTKSQRNPQTSLLLLSTANSKPIHVQLATSTTPPTPPTTSLHPNPSSRPTTLLLHIHPNRLLTPTRLHPGFPCLIRRTPFTTLPALRKFNHSAPAFTIKRRDPGQ